MSHPIKRYCERHGIRQRVFAARANLSEAYVSQLISGRESIGKQAAFKIVQATGGEISLVELLTWEPVEGRTTAAS